MIAGWADAELIHWFVTIVACAGAVTAIATAVWSVASAIPYLRGVEMNVVFSVQKLLLGKSLYSDPSDVQFDVTQYSPAYYYIVRVLASMLGLAADDAQSLTALGRGLSVVIALVTAGLVVIWARRVFAVSSRDALIVAGYGLVATSPWWFIARPDALLELCVVAGAWCATEARPEEPRRFWTWTLASVAAGWLAMLTKQNGAVVLLFPLLMPAVSRRWAAFSAVAIGILALVAATAWAAPHLLGPWVWANVVDGIKQPLSFFEAVTRVYTPLFTRHGFVLALLCFVTMRWAIERSWSRAILVLIGMLVITGGAGVVTALKKGASENYLNELLILGPVAIAVAFGRPKNAAAAARVEFAGLRGVLAMWLVVTFGWFAFEHMYFVVYGRSENFSFRPLARVQFASYEPARAWLRPRLNAGPDTWFLSFELAVNNLIPDRALIPQKEIAMYAFDQHHLDYRKFGELLRAGKVPFAVSDAGGLPTTFLGADLSPFELVQNDGALRFYVWQDARRGK